jgi:hypothetical protein
LSLTAGNFLLRRKLADARQIRTDWGFNRSRRPQTNGTGIAAVSFRKGVVLCGGIRASLARNVRERTHVTIAEIASAEKINEPIVAFDGLSPHIAVILEVRELAAGVSAYHFLLRLRMTMRLSSSGCSSALDQSSTAQRDQANCRGMARRGT